MHATARRISSWVLGLLWLLTGTGPLCAESLPGRFEHRVLVDEQGSHRYQVYLPPGYTTSGDTSSRKWPLLVFLHGAGERGTDGLTPTQYGLGPALQTRSELYPCVVVFPQCESWDDRIETSWSSSSESGRLARAIIAAVEQREAIDPQQRILTGWSMGGFGAVQWAAGEPDRWKRVLAVSGGATSTGAPAFPSGGEQAPLWLIHGSQDAIVSVERSQTIAARWPATTPNRFDEVPSAGHEVWDRVYGDPRVAQWLLTGGEIPAIDWSHPDETLSGPRLVPTTPFVVAAQMQRAVELRLGNDSLAMLSAGIPEAASPERLQGTFAEIHQTFTVDGQKYQLRLSDLSYTARLVSARVATRATADVQVDLGVGIELRIGAAHLTTDGFVAHTGPFRIVIGHQRATPLSLTVKPRIDQGRIRLTLGQSGFPIENDNWFVERPQEITVQGTKFNRYEIETGIVGGLYTRKKEVEEVITSVIPTLLTRVEGRLNQETSSQVTQWLWPFPVFPPRVRLKAEALSVDREGLTLTMGVDLAASRPAQGPLPTVRQVVGRARLPDKQRRSSDLHFELDHQLTDLVSQEFTDSGAARIHVLDIPEPKFATFANWDRMQPFLPEAQRATTGELRTVLAITGPFQWRIIEPSVDNRPARTVLEIPQARLELATRPDAAARWQPAGAIDVAVRQPIDIQFERRDPQPPQMTLIWSDRPEVTLRGPESVAPAEWELLQTEMREAWIAWGKAHGMATKPIDDFVIGDSRLRLGGLTINETAVRVDLFSPHAYIQAVNQPLRYRIRDLRPIWSPERTLSPGESEQFPLINPIQWRITGEDEVRTLRPGERVLVE